MSQQIVTDIVIIGGGIAGLWLNARLHQLGYSALVIENNTLGGGQSVKSQGIIHGGTKYALNGALTGASEAISGMPKRWRDCLVGKGELDLTGVNILSHYHYLWSPGSIAGNLMSFFASKALRTRVKQVKNNELPIALQDKQFMGKAYQLDELVLDVPTLISRLVELSENRVLAAKSVSAISVTKDKTVIKADDFTIETQVLVLSAGEGNEELIKSFNLTKPAMQLRPLHMVMVKSPNIKPLYAHCLGAGVKPRLTVTTHYHQDSTPVWYLGAELSEASGVARSESEQIEFAKSEVAKLIPWIDLSNAEWATLRVNRAEPAQNSLMRPDNAFIAEQLPIIVGWPTKLALAPDFADQCIHSLQKNNIKPLYQQSLPELHKPCIAKRVWDELLP
ncbi:FAD-dependent oxidoreductase [Entomomonas asaccharolytica]|uniref:FAD-dependent oxidoreductase n=1 Tax=Entomomonas asaccharolytica TaxID=2785331 RepID=A0A974NG34_9GAMM|nr:FAD-dependent oxidoreductase [Entomomonas asaccharolytica]QQP86141.1 FAD-dependent oxidoreductase [Entomomonas asaccharolytica]